MSLLMLGVNLPVYSQPARKPTLMVVPSDAWCNDNGFLMEFDNQGSVVKVPDYRNALLNMDLSMVIAKIGELMLDRGFPLKYLESSLKTLQDQSAEDALLTNKSGSDMSESPIERLKQVAKADIWMQLAWTVNKSGPRKSISFTLQAFDAYTDKQVAGASGTGNPSTSAELPVLLGEAVLAHLDKFNASLQSHFEDMFANGREVIIRIRKWDSWDEDLETEFDGTELRDIIENWVHDNTVENRFSTTDATENMMLFEQVRIPLYDANGRATDARQWTRGLQKMLKDKYDIASKLMTKGLGQAQLVIGEK